MTLELHATPEEVMRAVAALQRLGREKQLAEREVFGLALALEECASNIVEHAYHRDGRHKLQVIIDYRPGSVVLELHDRGPEFDPTAPVRGPQSASSSESASLSRSNSADPLPGGWGILLVRHYMDEISYRRESGENVLRLTKRLAAHSGRANAPVQQSIHRRIH